MKKERTINVSNEVYEFLINLSKEIRDQDNRGTAFPYFYQIQQEKEVPVPEGCGDEVWVMDGEVHLRTEEDIREAVFEYKCWNLDSKSDQDKYLNLTSWEVEEILSVNYRKFDVSIEHSYSNMFLTHKAYLDHVKCNGHNLNNPKSFLFYAYRNSEMSQLIDFILSLTDKK